MMEPEKEGEYHCQTGYYPVCQAPQSLYLAQRRAEIAVAQNRVIAVARHAITLDHHALLFAPGVMLIANVALAADTLPRIKIMRDQIRGPLGGTHRLTADIADV